MNFTEALIGNLIEQNHRVGILLHKQGVRFDDAQGMRLQELCELQKNDYPLIAAQVQALLAQGSQPVTPDLNSFSVKQLIQYLEQTHHDYIRVKIPTIGSMIGQLAQSYNSADFEILVPAFEDFTSHLIEHITYEEEQVFPYIKTLIKMATEKFLPPELLVDYKNTNIHVIQSRHGEDGDELSALKALTDNFTVEPTQKLSYQVVLKELKDLEHDLAQHGHIEDHYLFPQAEMLERFYAKKSKLIASLN